MANEKVITITKDNFDTLINGERPLLVDFWASWCGPCRFVAPIIDELAQEFEGEITVGKLNVDEESGLAAKYNVMSIPTIMLFKNGRVVDRLVGARQKDDFVNMIKKNI